MQSSRSSASCVSRGLAIAARTYRKQPARVADRTVTDALVEDKIRELAWTFNATTRRWQMTPEGLYGRRKWVALLRRQEGLAGTSRGAVDRAMRTLALEGIRRAKKIRTTIPGPDGKRAGDLLNRDFTAPPPNLAWVTDFTYVRTWAGFVFVAFVVDVFVQRIVGWHASSSMPTDLVMAPQRDPTLFWTMYTSTYWLPTNAVHSYRVAPPTMTSPRGWLAWTASELWFFIFQ